MEAMPSLSDLAIKEQSERLKRKEEEEDARQKLESEDAEAKENEVSLGKQVNSSNDALCEARDDEGGGRQIRG